MEMNTGFDAGIPVRRNTVCKVLFVLLFIALSSLCGGCDKATGSGPVTEPNVTIVEPQVGDVGYDPFNPITIIYKYNPTVFKAPASIAFSKDDKLTWKTISMYRNEYGYPQTASGGSFRYYAVNWTPEKDSLSQVSIYIKVTGYDPDPDDIAIVGPILIN